MASVNKVILIGNLGADPDMRYTASGRLSSTSTWPLPKSTRTRKRREWHKIIVWDKQAECVEVSDQGLPGLRGG